MIFIPIGVDCGITKELKENGLRIASYPFDWMVTYNGIFDIIRTRFASYLPVDPKLYDEYDFESRKMRCNRSSNTLFMHNIFPDDFEKLIRRINRFYDVLENETDEVIFIRKGHSPHHHGEAEKYKVNLKNDLIDVEQLCAYLLQKYPKLKFKIVIFLFCDTCFTYDKSYITKYPNIFVYHTKENEWFQEIFMKKFLPQLDKSEDKICYDYYWLLLIPVLVFIYLYWFAK